MPKLPVTIAIITNNRPHLLARCLQSICSQTNPPTQTLIIDNHPSQSAKDVANQYSTLLTLTYFHEPHPGVPTARNLALKKCSTYFLSFIDDDCVADQLWLQTALDTITTKKVSYIIGQNQLSNPQNLFASAQHYRQTYWFNYKLKGYTTSPYNLDTKNIIINTTVVKKYRLSFDPSINIGRYDSVDTDLGFQIHQKKLVGYYQPKMIVKHLESDTFSNFKSKAYFRGQLAYLLHQKWHLEGELVNLNLLKATSYLKSLRFWPQEYQHYLTNIPTTIPRKLAIFLLIKYYDQLFLQGFLDKQNHESAQASTDKARSSP